MGQGMMCRPGAEDASGEFCRCCKRQEVQQEKESTAARTTGQWVQEVKDSTVTCLEADHIRELEASLADFDPELAKHLKSPEFIDHCLKVFQAHDADGDGFLSAGHEAAQISSAVHEVLPGVFLDRLDGVPAEQCALSFDQDWDGKVTPEEFAGFVRWAAVMKARGFFHGSSPFRVIGEGCGERLMVVSEYMDEDGTLHAAVKSSCDLALYNPSGITRAEFARQLEGAVRVRDKAGLPRYQTVALANHGPDPTGLWEPFCGKARKLTKKNDVTEIFPAFMALAGLLPSGGGGRLDLLACDLASAPGGMDLIRRLEKETGHTVCASKDATGNAAQGGNWDLEVGDVNVASTYFDEEKLQQFERLMRNKLPPKKRNRNQDLVYVKGKTRQSEDTSSDDDE